MRWGKKKPAPDKFAGLAISKTSVKKISGVTVATLDRAFSLKIRARDCPEGWGFCITCEQPKGYGEMDCGHYLGRQYFATRWDPMNCAAQCQTCNRYNEGLKAKFRVALVAKYGEDAITRMELLHKIGKKPDSIQSLEIRKKITAM